jgi:hypothetical protein
MIKGILIVNNYGKPRLAKFYQSVVSGTTHQSARYSVTKLIAFRCLTVTDKRR